MKSKYLNSVLILALFTMVITLSAFFSISEAAGFADASINSENADTMDEGASVKCTLTSGNNFMTAYKIKPSKSGWHLFFISGSVKEIKGKLYEGVGDTGSLESSRYEYDDEGHLYFSYNLTAGNEYTFLIQSTVESEDSVFDAGYIYTDTDEDVFLASASEITLTETNKNYMFGVFGDSPPDTEWVISDHSIVSSSLSISSGYFNVIRLEAKKNGTAYVKLVNKNGNVLANCKVTCAGLTEYYDLYVSGVRVNNKNASSITGPGISGSVSYDQATNTLYLENAVLTSAIKTEGFVAPPKGSDLKGSGYDYPESGNFCGVINNHTVDTFKVVLKGTNKINNVTLAEQNSGSNYDASYSYTGVDGISSCGPVVFEGNGSLTIDSASIGTAVYSAREVSVAEGASLSIRETNANNANGITALSSVNVNGNLKIDVATNFFMVNGRKACVAGYGIKTGQLTVGSKGNAVLNASTDCEVSSYCVLLDYNGSASISGTLSANAFGASGESAGYAMGSDDGAATLSVSGSGSATFQGNNSALEGIVFKAPILVKAGSSASDARTISPSSYNGETYVKVSVPSACSGGHKLTKTEAKDSTEEATGNIEYWLCSECGKLFSDSEGKTEITAESTVIPRKPARDSSLYLVKPDNGETFNVGDTIDISAYSDIYVYRYMSGILLEGAPNYIYVRVLKDGSEVASDTLFYYEVSERVGTSFKADSAGKYTIQISKSSEFTTLNSVDIQVGKPDDNSSDNTGTDNPANNSGTDKPQENPTGEPSNSQGSAAVPEKQTGADGTALGKGASVQAAEAAIEDMKSDSDLPGAVFNKLQLKSSKQTNTSISLSWKKVSGAKKYVIYGNKCGKSNKMQKIAVSTGKSRKITKVLGKKLKKGTYYKFMILALDKNGEKVVSSSKIIHVATKGGKAGNVSKVTTKASKNKVTISKGKKFKLAGKQVAASKKLKVKPHRPVTYETTNAKIATVSKKGVITGKKKGTCYIYAYAQNGVFAKIKVTVK